LDIDYRCYLDIVEYSSVVIVNNVCHIIRKLKQIKIKTNNKKRKQSIVFNESYSGMIQLIAFFFVFSMEKHVILSIRKIKENNYQSKRSIFYLCEDLFSFSVNHLRYRLMTSLINHVV
jgi:hypothetical protein